MTDLSVDEIKALLQRSVTSLVAELCPGGKREARYWVSPNPSRLKDGRGSFKVHLTGEAAGGFVEYDSGGTQSGTVFDLIILAGRASDYAGAVKWAKAWLGLEDADPAALKKRVKDAEDYKKRVDQDEEEARRVKIRAARDMFRRAVPLRCVPEAVAYLESRGIEAGLETLSSDVRALPSLPYHEAGAPARYFPAIVCAMRDAEGTINAVHRTWLAPDGSGKAPVGSPKKMLGAKRGCAVRVLAVESDTVILTEGLEDALTIVQAFAGHDGSARRVHMVGDLGNLALYAAPSRGPAIREIIVMGDNDWDNPAAQAGLQRALAELASRFDRVRLAMAPNDFKDINDLLQRRRAQPQREGV